MREHPLQAKLLPRDKHWLKLFVMAEALGPPPSVSDHREHFRKRRRAGRQPEVPKL